MTVLEWFYRIPLNNVQWGAPEAGAVLGALCSGRFRGERDARALEEAVRRLTGAARAVAFERGRSALRWLLETAARSPARRGRRRVLFPALLCRAVHEAVCAAGLEPVLFDVTEELTADPASAAAVFDPERTLAVVVPHIYGRPSPVEPFLDLVEGTEAVVVDDAAAALGTVVRGRALGLHGHGGLYSFSQGKAACAGGGGVAVLPSRGPLAEAASAGLAPKIEPPCASRTGLLFRRFLWHDLLHRWSGPMERARSILSARIGLSTGRRRRLDVSLRGMGGLSAAAARAQVARLEETARGRARNFARLEEELRGVLGLRVLHRPAEGAPTRFLVETLDLEVKRDARGIREENPLAAHLRKAGIEAGYAYLPLHRYPGGEAMERAALPVTERLAGRLLLLPFLPPMGRGAAARIGKAVRSFYGV